MAREIITLTDEQKRRNAEILARIAEEERRVLEETRALQDEWKSSYRRRRDFHPRRFPGE
jgi:hypothetical protein